MKVLGIIAAQNDPSSRIRILQYKKWFSIRGEQLDTKIFTPLKEEEPSSASVKIANITGVNKWRIWNSFKEISRLPLLSKQYNYDVLWQLRLLIPENYSLEKFYRKPFVFDFDDAIWINEGEKHVIKAIKKSDKVFAGNTYLSDFASKYNSKVALIPTTVDTEKHFPINREQQFFTVGWIGTTSNFIYLEVIKDALLEFLRKNADAQLIIVSSVPPSFLPFDNKQIVFKKWQEDKENELVNEFSIGIMPLPDNEWTKGKCGYKLLQYMACNKPFIASPVGINALLIEKSESGLSAISENQWLSKLQDLKNDHSVYSSLSKNGRAFVEEHYSAKVWSNTIIEEMKQLIND